MALETVAQPEEDTESDGPDLTLSFAIDEGPQVILGLRGPDGPIGHVHLDREFLRLLAAALVEVKGGTTP